MNPKWHPKEAKKTPHKEILNETLKKPYRNPKWHPKDTLNEP